MGSTFLAVLRIRRHQRCWSKQGRMLLNKYLLFDKRYCLDGHNLWHVSTFGTTSRMPTLHLERSEGKVLAWLNMKTPEFLHRWHKDSWTVACHTMGGSQVWHDRSIAWLEKSESDNQLHCHLWVAYWKAHFFELSSSTTFTNFEKAFSN